MAEPDDSTLDELKRRGRRRLVGAVVLALVAAVVVPMLLESEPRPLGEDVSVRIPPVDDARPATKLGTAKGRAEPPRPEVAPDNKGEAPRADAGAAAPPAGPAAPPPAAAPSTPANPVATPATATPAPAAPEPSSTPRKSLPDAEKSVLAPGTRPTPLEPSKAALDAPRPESTPAGSTATKSPAGTAPAAPAKAPAAATAAPKAPPAPAATPKDGYVVQLGAFTDDKGANALANRLKKAGYSAYTEALTTSRGAMWRVRVGPFPTRDAATQARDRLKTEGQAGIVVQAR